MLLRHQPRPSSDLRSLPHRAARRSRRSRRSRRHVPGESRASRSRCPSVRSEAALGVPGHLEKHEAELRVLVSATAQDAAPSVKVAAGGESRFRRGFQNKSRDRVMIEISSIECIIKNSNSRIGDICNFIRNKILPEMCKYKISLQKSIK